jgi:hypothetical protein
MVRMDSRLKKLERVARGRLLQGRNAALVATIKRMSDTELITRIEAAPPEAIAFLQATGLRVTTTLDVMYLAGASEEELDQKMREMIAEWQQTERSPRL